MVAMKFSEVQVTFIQGPESLFVDRSSENMVTFVYIVLVILLSKPTWLPCEDFWLDSDSNKPLEMDDLNPYI
jgi:hypothetical protein